MHDLKYALRLCARTPAFTATAVLALAIGIGASTAIFTVVNAVLIERLPFRDPARLVMVWEESARQPNRPNVASPANYLRWRERQTVFDGLAAMVDVRVNLTGRGAPEEIGVQYVTADFMPLLGVAPIVGRGFSENEFTNGNENVALLSYGLWQRRFGGSADAIGETMRLSGTSCLIVGVMPPGYGLTVREGSLTGKPADVWQPYAMTAAHREPRGRYIMALARLKPGVTLDAAQAQMTAISAGLTAEFPAFDTGWTTRLVPLHQQLAGAFRPALLVLMGAVAFVLLIACANVANLLLARGAARRREIAIRTALGAGRARVMRQLMTESLVLALLGGGLGLLVAQWGVAGLVALSPVDLFHERLPLNLTVLAFTSSVSVATALIAGFLPALEASRADMSEAMADGARQAGGGVHTRRLRHAFFVAEVALAVVLLVGGGLMMRSLTALRSVNPGFNADHVLTVRVSLPTGSAAYKDAGARMRFFDSAVERVASLPGVTGAGAISFLPLAGLAAATSFTIAGEPPPPPGQQPVTEVRVCDNGYFTSMQVPLVSGRLFTRPEQHEPRNVAIVNEALVRLYFADRNPLGQRLLVDMTDPVVPTEIVGVVGDVKHADMATPSRPMVYWPSPQLPMYSTKTLTVRTAGDPLALAPAVEAQIRAIDKDQPVADVRTMEQWIGRSLAEARFSSLLLASFALVALLLAAIGIFGVISYTVTQRTPEIGVRLALGALARDIERMIVTDGLRLALGGLAIGVVLALALTRAVTSLLYDTSPTDPLTFAAALAILVGVAALASYLPARRASRITPVQALRYQ